MAKKNKPGLLSQLADNVTETINKTIGQSKDGEIDLSIVDALKADHEDLKSMIKILKAEDTKLAEKRKVYADFSSLLKSHAKAEEKAVYEFGIKLRDMKEMSYEGYEEHAVADSLMKKIAGTKQKDQWSARVKVLAELVEHHVKEEENEYFPELEKQVNERKRQEPKMVKQFVNLRQRSQTAVREDNAGVLSQI